MDRQKFAVQWDKCMHGEIRCMTRDERHDLAKEGIDKLDKSNVCMAFGSNTMVLIIEEFAELIQELTKIMRNPDKINTVGLLEETADAMNAIEYIQYIFGITDESLEVAQSIKMEVLAGKLQKLQKETECHSGMDE